MKNNLLLILPIVCFSLMEWHYDLGEARTIARKEHKHILLNFSGSDWCGPCIRMHQEIFENEAFLKMANTELVMVNADFPRMKKNRLSAKQLALNDSMADQYNSSGKFPFTLLLDADGKIIKKWDGYSGMSPEAFRDEVKLAIDTDKKQE